MASPASTAFGETDFLFRILFDMLWKWQANFTVHQHSLLRCSLLLSLCMKCNSFHLSLSDFFSPSEVHRFLYTHLAICSTYLFHEEPLTSFLHTSVSSLPVTLETLCPGTESKPLGMDCQTENCVTLETYQAVNINLVVSRYL